MEPQVQGHRSEDLHAAGDMEVRRRLHGMWAAVAAGWKENVDYVEQRAAPISRRLISLTTPAPGDRVLELACGAGGLGLEVARIVGPDGSVVVTDVTQEMTDIALMRASALGIRNVSGHTLDIEAIDQPDSSYDVVLCREGLMFALKPARAVAEMVRVLAPGGRFAVSVWGARSANPWLGKVFDAASEVLGRPVPPPGIPGPFSLGEAGQLSAALANSDIVDMILEEVPVETVVSSFQEYWQRTMALAGPLSKIVAELSPEGMARLEAKVREGMAPYESPSCLRVPGVALVAAGMRRQ